MFGRRFTQQDKRPQPLLQSMATLHHVMQERRFRCWITDRAIPLDEFGKYDGAVKNICGIAAFCCILRTTQHGLHLSDCRFFNFGVHFTEHATEQLVVIIDAGNKDIIPRVRWNKSQIDIAAVQKFWKTCAVQSATHFEIQDMWRYNHCYKEVLENATRKWQSWPFLSESNENTSGVWQTMTAKYGFRRSVAQTTSAYEIMEMVGRFTGEDHGVPNVPWYATEHIEPWMSCRLYFQIKILYLIYNQLSVNSLDLLCPAAQHLHICNPKSLNNKNTKRIPKQNKKQQTITQYNNQITKT